MISLYTITSRTAAQRSGAIDPSRMSIAVIIPTYRRPASLARCLQALDRQTLRPSRIVVAVRDSDVESRFVVERERHRIPELSTVLVTEPGVIAAMSAAIMTCREDVIACTDDDAVPRSDWIERMISFYAPGVGGVGGRDVIARRKPNRYDLNRTEPLKPVVGRLTRYGRLIGNHHRGCGPPRDVDVLKGVNMSLRRELWRLDTRLRGTGAQVAWEIAVCLHAKAAGWRLIYDPATAVDHVPAERFDADSRTNPTLEARTDAAWNEAYALASSLPPIKLVITSLVTLAIGSRAAPGPIFALTAVARSPRRLWSALSLTYRLTNARIHGTFSGLVKRLFHSTPTSTLPLLGKTRVNETLIRNAHSDGT